jgi:uncharacterized membrane protein
MTMQPDPAESHPTTSAAPSGPPPRSSAFDDARMDAIMGRLLQVGVLLAASVVLAGGVMLVRTHAGERVDYRSFIARPLQLRHPAALLRGIAAGDAAAIVQLGILLLVATPIGRVAFAVVAFALERDRLYVAVSLTVLAVLLFGMLRGG